MQINGFPVIIGEFSDRTINWIHERLNYNGPYISSSEQKRTLIQLHMHNSKENYERVEDLSRQGESHQLPDEELEWVERNNFRLLRWIIHYCSCLYEADTYIPTLINTQATDLELYDYFVTSLDLWSENLQRKRLTLFHAKSAWSKLLQKDKDLSWLDGQNDHQIEWVWGYLNVNITIPYKYNPTNSGEMFSYILSIFDCWEGPQAEMQLLQGKMKRAWAQQKYRNNLKDRKQTTFVLSLDTKEQLQKMAKTQNVNLNQMLEYLINKEYISFKENLKKNKPYTKTLSVDPNNPPNPASSPSAQEDA